MDAGIPQVKLIDRTFNANPKRALEIFQFLVEENRRRGAFKSRKPPTIFHFEISADILTEELLTYLAAVPSGLFQFEIGIQSTTPAVLDVISRRSEWNRLARNVMTLAENVHLHLDLIAGLPEEPMPVSPGPLMMCTGWAATVFQLGFLKLLKGSGLRRRSKNWGCF